MEIGYYYLTQNPLKYVSSAVYYWHVNLKPYSYFSEIEQVAFAPSHVVPGWEASMDPVLQSRMFAYSGKDNMHDYIEWKLKLFQTRSAIVSAKTICRYRWVYPAGSESDQSADSGQFR